jgi:hypothetical protein
MEMNEIETVVLDQAKSVLGNDTLELTDDFFDAGGDSVAGMHYVGRVGRLLGLPIRTTLLFGSPVLADFAAGVAKVQRRQAEAAGSSA